MLKHVIKENYINNSKYLYDFWIWQNYLSAVLARANIALTRWGVDTSDLGETGRGLGWFINFFNSRNFFGFTFGEFWFNINKDRKVSWALEVCVTGLTSPGESDNFSTTKIQFKVNSNATDLIAEAELIQLKDYWKMCYSVMFYSNNVTN